MQISSLIPFFKKNKKKLSIPDSILIKRVKNLTSQKNIEVYLRAKIYHHTKSDDIELLLFDMYRGIYLFEIKTWTYKELKNAHVQKAQQQENATNTLAFDKTHTIIEKKLDELTNQHAIPIYNYLLMENLNADEYEHLDESFQALIPKNRIIFSDTTEDEIIQKLQSSNSEPQKLNLYKEILENLFIQYSILDENNALHLCTEEQRVFIDSDIYGLVSLYGLPRSGKSNTILLKAIVELLNQTSEQIIIIKPTLLACDIFKKKLLDIVEHAIVTVDLTSIKVLTPQQFNKCSLGHRCALICDDVELLENDFIESIKNTKKTLKTVLVHNTSHKKQAQLTQNFRNIKREINFYKTDPYTKSLGLLSELINTKADNVLVVSNILSREKFNDALKSYINISYKIVDSKVHLANQVDKNISLCTYKEINEIKTDHIILLDIPFISKNEIEYAFNLANKTVDILYEEDCEEIRHLRKIYEDN